MKIGIQAKEITTRNGKALMVEKVCALKIEELPVKYLCNLPHVFLTDDCIIIKGKTLCMPTISFLKVGHYYPEQEFEKLIKIICVAAKRLRKIKRKHPTWGATRKLII